MPILYNFHILVVTFYTILGLTYWSSAQCQFLFVACFCFVENPYQMESKRDKNLLRFFWNICDFLEKESTRDNARGVHEEVGAPLSPQESQYPDKNHVWIWAQSELQIFGNLRNGERVESGSAKTKGNREREIQSRGDSHPSATMEAMDQRVNPSPT